jgi:tagatose 6-phosphate kinase
VIVTVTLNAALDVTYRVKGEFALDETNRVDRVADHAGGKGINVARVLHSFGDEVVATGLLGGCTGARIRSLLDADGLRHRFVRIADESRRTTVLTDAVGATGLWEPGPVVTEEEWRAFHDAFTHDLTHDLAHARAVVLAGSLPPGVPIDAYAQMIGIARAAGAYTILDADGAALRHGIEAHPDLVKPNAAELAGLTGEPVDGVAQATRAAKIALGMGAAAVVATLGDAGMVLVSPDTTRQVRQPQRFDGNPVGAGDACTAALARSVGRPWDERLRDAAAMSAASVLAPVAGVVDQETYRRLRQLVAVEGG